MLKRRRILKWIGLVSCVLILGVWVASTIWVVRWTAATRLAVVGSGSCLFAWFADEYGVWDFLGYPMAYQGSPTELGWLIAPYQRWPEISLDNPEWVMGRLGLVAPDMRTTHWLNGTPGKRYGTHVDIPLWLPFLIVALPTTLLFYRDRKRLQPGNCGACGYDLTGNTSGVCSECGDILPGRAGWATGLASRRRSVVVSLTGALLVFFLFLLLLLLLISPATMDWILAVGGKSVGEVAVALLAPAAFAWLLVGLLAATAAYKRLRRRTIHYEHRYCLRCDYDLTANITEICPGCGTALPQAETDSH